MLQCQLKSHLYLKRGIPFLKFWVVSCNIFIDITFIWYSLVPLKKHLSLQYLICHSATCCCCNEVQTLMKKNKFHGFITLNNSIFTAVWLIKMIWNYYRNWWKIWLPDIIVNVLSLACQIDNGEQHDFKHSVNHFLVKFSAEGGLQYQMHNVIL